MSRLVLLLLALCAFATLVFSAPVPTGTATADLAKRTDHTGKGTYFETGLGACGKTNQDSDHIVALPASQYDGGSHCGVYVHVENTSNGKTVYAQVEDECPSCGYGSLDMSPSAFSSIGPKSEGVLPIKWHFMAKGWSP